MTEKKKICTAEEIEVLQELMNIAFGNATADLAEVIDIYVVLNVPEINMVNAGDLPTHLKSAIDARSESGIVQQKFWGDFNGSGLLVFPRGGGKDLLNLLDENKSTYYENTPIATLEKGVFLEVANILIGACVGKFSELLETFVTYSPPQFVHGDSEEFKLLINHFDSTQTAIIMKTVFQFDKKNITGLLLLITNEESIGWLRSALKEFMEDYE